MQRGAGCHASSSCSPRVALRALHGAGAAAGSTMQAAAATGRQLQSAPAAGWEAQAGWGCGRPARSGRASSAAVLPFGRLVLPSTFVWMCNMVCVLVGGAASTVMRGDAQCMSMCWVTGCVSMTQHERRPVRGHARDLHMA